MELFLKGGVRDHFEVFRKVVNSLYQFGLNQFCYTGLTVILEFFLVEVVSVVGIFVNGEVSANPCLQYVVLSFEFHVGFILVELNIELE